MRFRLSLLLAVSGLQPVIWHTAHATDLCTSITSNRTLTLAESPYVVTCPITISNNATLTIEAGVVVRFDSTASLTVGYSYFSNYGGECSPGRLVVNGTADAMVTFTSSSGDSRGWQGLIFSGCSYVGAYPAGRSRLTHCIVEYGGVPQGTSNGRRCNIRCDASASPVLSDCVIRNAQGAGVIVERDGRPSLTASEVSGNSGHGIAMWGYTHLELSSCRFRENNDCDVASEFVLPDWPSFSACDFETGSHLGVDVYGQSIMQSCTFTGTGQYGLRVSPGSEITDLTLSGYGDARAVLLGPFSFSSVTIPALGPDQYYVSEATLTCPIFDEETVIISAGVTIKFAVGASLTVGRMNLNPNYGWQCVGDGRLVAVGTPDLPITLTSLNGEPGGWQGVQFNSCSSVGGQPSELRYCVVENGGAPRTAYPTSLTPADIACITARPTITNCVIRDALGAGLVSASPPGSTTTPTIFNSAFEGNTVGLSASGGTVTAMNNWWGDSSGPLDASTSAPDYNPGGLGQTVSDGVSYRPWLLCPPPVAPYLVEPRVQSPGPGDYWTTGVVGTAAQVTVRWTAPSLGVDHVCLEFSRDAGMTWATLAKDGAGDPLRLPAGLQEWVGPCELPATDDTLAAVRLKLYDSNHRLLSCNMGEPFALVNNAAVRLDIVINELSQKCPPIIFWTPRAGAAYYHVEVVTDAAHSCAQDFWTIDQDGARNWVPFAPEAWHRFPASRCAVTIAAYGADHRRIGEVQEMTFVKFRLDDLDPGNQEPYSTKPPVLLVHGWTSNRLVWSICDQSPLISGLIDGPVGQRLHPWALEYPNIGPIRHSAAGLNAAVEYLLSLPEAADSVSLVAHSMGGLVCRTYLEGLGVDPKNDATTGPPLNNTSPVSRLVTLSSPLLGEPFGAVRDAARFQALFTSCSGIQSSASNQDLRSNSALLSVLSTRELPPTWYFFAAGTDFLPPALARRLQGVAASWYLDKTCPAGNDNTVDVCSAQGGCGGDPNVYGEFRVDRRAVIQGGRYSLDHGPMSKPGNVIASCGSSVQPYSESHRRASEALGQDVLAFLRSRPSLPSVNCPPQARTAVRHRITDAGHGSWQFHARGGSSPATESQLVPGAQVQVFTSEAPTAAALTTCADAQGLTTFDVPPGTYLVRISAKGYLPRADTLRVTTEGGLVLREANLDLDHAYVGPSAPQLVINGGAATTTDSVVSLAMACSGALDMLVREAGGSGSWQPFAAASTFALSGEGPHVLRAQFRDAEGVLSDSVEALIELVPAASAGAIQVTSSPYGAEIQVDGQSAATTTPATITNLSPGFHLVRASIPGFECSPQQQSVFVDSQTTATVAFDLSPTQPPSATTWIVPEPLGYLGDGAYLSWTRSVDPEAEGVFYTLALTDTTGVRPPLTLAGLTNTAWTVSQTLPDSSVWQCAIAASDGRSQAQLEPPATRIFFVDRTPPIGAVLSPRLGDSLLAGEPARITVQAADWGALQMLTVVASVDGGQTFVDTLYAGAYRDSLTCLMPAVESVDVLVRADFCDAAGNTTAVTSQPFVLVRGRTGVAPRAGETLSLTTSPNPIRHGAVIRLGLPTALHVDLTIFDITGRVVRQLLDATMAPGRREVTWDARTSTGTRVSAGVYFVHARCGETLLRRPVVVVR